jgi:hypothetical protein
MTTATRDATKPLAMAKFKKVAGHPLNAGTPITVTDSPAAAGEVDAETADRLFAAGLAIYADKASATPVETHRAAAERLTEIDDLGGGSFLVRGPGINQRFRGRAKAEAARDKAIEDADALADTPTTADIDDADLREGEGEAGTGAPGGTGDTKTD